MSDRAGPRMWEAMRSIRALHRQVAALLGDATEHLARTGYPRLPVSPVASLSYTLERPHRWLPPAVCVFHGHPTRADAACFVSVLLAPRGPEHHARPFTEPLLSVGWLRFDRPVTTKGLVKYEMCWPILNADVDRDGTWATGERIALAPPSVVDQACMARPLVDVDSTATLVRDALEPLIERGRGMAEAAGG